VADGVDPSDVRKRARNADKEGFEVLAKQRLAEQTLRPATLKKKNRVLKYLVAQIGSRPVSKITTPFAFPGRFRPAGGRTPRYSALSVSIGSMAAARRAGT
jgi:hypothetical protein